MPDAATSFQHAIVIGGSITGLLAAQALAQRFRRVTVIERDQFADQPLPRKGVPQASHVHVLLRKGMLLLDQFFPAFGEELAARGAPRVDWTEDLAFRTRGGWGPRFPSGFTTYTCSRGLLEYLIHRRLAQRSQLQWISHSEVTGLSADPQGRVQGVKMRPRGGAGGEPAGELTADLVLDASGRSSRAAEWLAGLGYSVPDEVVVDSNLGYASRVYRRPPDFTAGWKVLMVRDRPPFGTRGGVIFPVENGQWMVNLGGAGGDYPPTDEAGFEEFARSLIAPEFYQAFQHAKPLSAITGYRRTANRLNRFAQMPRWPEGLLVAGDALCAFNPVYGQGMSVAAVEAAALGKWLNSSANCFSFQKELAQIVRTPWLMATNEDLRVVKNQGARPGLFEGLLQRYIEEVLWLSASDRDSFSAFLNVSHLVKQPGALFHPRLAVKVFARLVSKPEFENPPR